MYVLWSVRRLKFVALLTVTISCISKILKIYLNHYCQGVLIDLATMWTRCVHYPFKCVIQRAAVVIMAYSKYTDLPLCDIRSESTQFANVPV